MNENRQFPVISAIVPCYKQTEELQSCLLALSRQDFEHPYEVILVDSAFDPEVARLAEAYPKVQLIRSEERLICASAKNLGAEYARGEYLAFTDADCIPESDWIQQVHDSLYAGKLAVGGPVLDALPRSPIAVTDNLLQFAEVPPGRPAGRILHAPGCNFGVRQEVFHRAGAFPLFEVGEDVSLTGSINRLYSEGIHFNPEMRVAHTGRRTIARMWDHQKNFGYWRGKLGLHISKRQQRLGRRLFITPFVVTKRFFYIFKCVVRWNKGMLARNILLIPCILAGLISWSLGYRQGCLHAASKPEGIFIEG